MTDLTLLQPRDALRLLEPGPVVLVTSMFKGQPNLMAAAWIRAVSADPTLLGVSIQPSRLTHRFISETDQFGISIPTADLLAAVHFAGTTSGRDGDKFAGAGLEPVEAGEIEVPLVKGAVAQIECVLEDRVTVGDHDLFVGRVLVASASPDGFNGRWQPESEAGRLLHHLGGDRYATLGRSWTVTPPAQS